MDLSEIQAKIDELEAEVVSSCTKYPPEHLHLDTRCEAILVAEEFIATTHIRQLEYYGGFEYVESKYTLQIGKLKLYLREEPSGRVDEVITQLEFEED